MSDELESKEVNEAPEAIEAETKTETTELTSDMVKKWVDTPEGKQFFQSQSDKRVTQALKTYKEKHFADEVEATVQEEMRKRNPALTEDQKRLAKIEKEMAGEKKARQRAEMGRVAVTYANQKSLDVGDLLERFVDDNEDQTREWIDQFDNYVRLREQQAVNRVMANGATKVESGDDNEALRFNSLEEIKRYLDKYPDKYEEVKPHYEKLVGRLRR